MKKNHLMLLSAIISFSFLALSCSAKTNTDVSCSNEWERINAVIDSLSIAYTNSATLHQSAADTVKSTNDTKQPAVADTEGAVEETLAGAGGEGVTVGIHQNTILRTLLSDSTLQSASETEIMEQIISIYEQQQHLPLSPSLKSYLLSYHSEDYVAPDNELTRTNTNFISHVFALPKSQMRAYTDEYLECVRNSTLSQNDKLVLTIGASVAYYSYMLWANDSY